jgi:hypothetical protein
LGGALKTFPEYWFNGSTVSIVEVLEVFLPRRYFETVGHINPEKFRYLL